MIRPVTVRSAPTPPWADDLDALAPTVLVLGGFLTAPPLYGPFRRRLLERGAADVVVSRAWTHHWLFASVTGLGPVVEHGDRAVHEAVRVSDARPRSRGAPLLVVGHSAGGIVGRLLTAERPYAGREHALAPHMAALVTLGTPHHVADRRFAGRRIGDMAARFADRAVPGAAFAPQTGYVSVASRAVLGRPDGTGRERVAYRLYQALLHDPRASTIEGDGVVPVRSALLEGARQIVLDDVAHGQGAGRPWYGADSALDVWWPVALEAWRSALRARLEG